VTFGGPTDLWGLSWTYSDINSSGFGGALSFMTTGVSPANVDYFKFKVYYTTGDIIVHAATRYCNVNEDIFMQKNVAGQKIGAQLITIADGSEFTGAVTVYVTGDAGTQAIGSVGSGACTHEGHGFHTYAPAQAETNYDIIAFTFVGTGAFSVTIQCTTKADANLITWLGTAPLALSSQQVQAVVPITQKVDVETIKTQAVVLAGTVTFPAATLASTTNITAGTITTVTTVTTVNGLAASALADMFDTNSGTTYGSAVAGSVVKEIVDNSGGSLLTVAAIADGVWDELLAGHAGAGSAGLALSSAGVAGDPWATALPGAYGAGTAGKIVGDNINATLSSRATASSITLQDAEIADIKAVTDQFVFTIPNQVDANSMTASAGGDQTYARYGAALTSSAGTEVRFSAWLERNGSIVAAPTSCAITVREQGSGSDLISVADAAPNGQGIFEMTQASPGFTSDRLYIVTVSIVEGGDTWETRYDAPVFG
jgi:hypothetical protein